MAADSFFLRGVGVGVSGFLIVDFGVAGEDEAAIDAVAVDAACFGFGFGFAFGVDGSAALAF